MNQVQYVDSITAEQIAAPTHVCHPALDWVADKLIMGVVAKGGHRALLSSTGRFIPHREVGELCPLGHEFTSPVTSNAVRSFFASVEAKRFPSGSELVKRIANHLSRLVAFPEAWMATTVATWILGTYVYPVFQAFPYLRITSPTPGCGKSILGQAIARLSFNGEFLTAPNEAHLFRLAELSRGVQVWDEAEWDTEVMKKRFESLMTILLNGYRNGGVVPRTRSKDYEQMQKYHVFCPRVLIGLSDLPKTVKERTIVIEMAKRSQAETVEIYNPAKHAETETSLTDECVVWALRNAPAVASAYHDQTLRGRVENAVGEVGRQADDIWLPLYSVLQATPDTASGEIEDTFAVAAKVHRSKADEGGSTSTGSEVARRHLWHDELVKAATTLISERSLITPTELAELINAAAGNQVSVQRLSKTLSAAGIKTRMIKGQRMFVGSKRALRGGLDASQAAGQQRQQHQDSQLTTEGHENVKNI